MFFYQFLGKYYLFQKNYNRKKYSKPYFLQERLSSFSSPDASFPLKKTWPPKPAFCHFLWKDSFFWKNWQIIKYSVPNWFVIKKKGNVKGSDEGRQSSVISVHLPIGCNTWKQVKLNALMWSAWITISSGQNQVRSQVQCSQKKKSKIPINHFKKSVDFFRYGYQIKGFSLLYLNM